MKYLSIIFAFFLHQSVVAQYQGEIEGDTKIDGRLEIKKGSDNTFIGQNAGIITTIGLHNVFIGSAAGQINTEGNYNTFLGTNAGKMTDAHQNTFLGYNTGMNTTGGTDNTFVGAYAGEDNTSGSHNTAIGKAALLSCTNGSQNVALGFEAGWQSNGVSNLFLGYQAGRKHQAGMDNLFIGREAGYNNSNGSENVMIGYQAGMNASAALQSAQTSTLIGYRAGRISTGHSNTFLGGYAGHLDTLGHSNIYIGYGAGGTGSTLGYNVAIGYEASIGKGVKNSIAIGEEVTVNKSNKIILGNEYIVDFKVAVLPSLLSDERLKKNIQKTTVGLEFIEQLQPVQYHYQKGSGILFTGLIAQDVEKAAESVGFDFSGIVKPDGEDDYYSLRYGELVMPLINAVKDLSKKNSYLENMLNTLADEMTLLKAQIHDDNTRAATSEE